MIQQFNNLKSVAYTNVEAVKAKGYELAYSTHVEAGRDTITMNFLHLGGSVGYVILSNLHENGPNCWVISGSHVDADHRGQGLGKALYLAAFLFASIKAKKDGEIAGFLPNCSAYLPDYIQAPTSPDAFRVWASIGRQLCQPVVDIKTYLLAISPA
jgi:GNAT superfamily N-acetyltransferase